MHQCFYTVKYANRVVEIHEHALANTIVQLATRPARVQLLFRHGFFTDIEIK